MIKAINKRLLCIFLAQHCFQVGNFPLRLEIPDEASERERQSSGKTVVVIQNTKEVVIEEAE